jgi:hypothetical protein
MRVNRIGHEAQATAPFRPRDADAVRAVAEVASLASSIRCVDRTALASRAVGRRVWRGGDGNR